MLRVAPKELKADRELVLVAVAVAKNAISLFGHALQYAAPELHAGAAGRPGAGACGGGAERGRSRIRRAGAAGRPGAGRAHGAGPTSLYTVARSTLAAVSGVLLPHQTRRRLPAARAEQGCDRPDRRLYERDSRCARVARCGRTEYSRRGNRWTRRGCAAGGRHICTLLSKNELSLLIPSSHLPM